MFSFDQIDHQWLQRHIPLERPILRQWLSAKYLDNHRWHPTLAGVPQGGIISPVIANMTLDGMQKLLNHAFPTHSGCKVNLIRFADDFIITGASQTILEEQVKPLITQFLAERGLTLSAHKTHITHIETGFDFLGKNIRRYGDKLLIKPAKQSVKALLWKIRSLIKKGRQFPAEKLIAILNPVIRGWVNYHRHTVSKRTFAQVDHHIFWMIWRWACRRHPNKSKQWVKNRYFRTVGGQNWVFATDGNLEKQIPQRQIILAAYTPIRRHIKIRMFANPYDPVWESYFEQRLDTKMVDTLKGRGKLLRLWHAQHGRCPLCREPITKQYGGCASQIVWRSHGGGDEMDNRVLLHPNCHQQLHSQRLTIEKLHSDSECS